VLFTSKIRDREKSIVIYSFYTWFSFLTWFGFCKNYPVSDKASLDGKILRGTHNENFTWELSKKIASGISAIKRVGYSIPYKTLLSIYNSLVQPHLDYCISVWGSCSKSLSQRLLKLQNRAARVTTFSNYDQSTDELLRMVNWVKLDRQRLVDKSTMMYKIVNNMVPDFLSSHFVFRSDTLTYNLRDSDCSLAIPQSRTNYCKRSLAYSGAVLWNSLPLDIRPSPSLDQNLNLS